MTPPRAVSPVLLATIAMLALAVAIACRPLPPASPGQRLLRGRTDAPPEIQQDCDVTGERCTRCHDIDRVLAHAVTEPASWERLIERMRRMNGSGISRAETPRILRCLAYHSFGPSGLQQLDPPRSGL
jgi:hypothetical protein